MLFFCNRGEMTKTQSLQLRCFFWKISSYGTSTEDKHSQNTGKFWEWGKYSLLFMRELGRGAEKDVSCRHLKVGRDSD